MELKLTRKLLYAKNITLLIDATDIVKYKQKEKKNKKEKKGRKTKKCLYC